MQNKKSIKSEQKEIGIFIKTEREKKGMTQGDLAMALKTSQSAVARMESGGQNFTLEQLQKLGLVLEKQIINIKSTDTVDFEIEGARVLSGSIDTNTSKNGAINMLCATLVNTGKTTLHGIPRIEEVFRYIEILEGFGVSIKWISRTSLEVSVPKKISFDKINIDAMNKTRSFTFVGGLIHHSQKFTYPHSGGCKMGERTVAAHKYGLEELGVNIKTTHDTYEISHKNLHGGDISLYESSDTGAINLLIAASRIPEKTVIRFAPPNYQVQDVCFLLEKYGVKIEGIGTTTLTVHGKENIDVNIEHENSEDPIESMFFITAAIMTDSTLTIKRCPIDFLHLEIEKLRRMGQKLEIEKEYLSKNGITKLVDITVTPSKLTALHDKIHAQPFPGLQMDNLPFFVPIATKAEGVTLVHDWVYENRAIYLTELSRLGADIKLADPHRLFITGGNTLRGAQIVSPPALRPTAAILLTMLGASGTSTLRNVYSLKRGYEEIAERLNKLGAKIKVIS
jgi:UDP-N-acetylglucosamine 1-carboxyvinyltransferase